jgi:hypothetical protein
LLEGIVCRAMWFMDENLCGKIGMRRALTNDVRQLAGPQRRSQIKPTIIVDNKFFQQTFNVKLFESGKQYGEGLIVALGRATRHIVMPHYTQCSGRSACPLKMQRDLFQSTGLRSPRCGRWPSGRFCGRQDPDRCGCVPDWVMPWGRRSRPARLPPLCAGC